MKWQYLDSTYRRIGKWRFPGQLEPVDQIVEVQPLPPRQLLQEDPPVVEIEPLRASARQILVLETNLLVVTLIRTC